MSGVGRRTLLRGAGLAGVGMVVGAGTAVAVSFHNPFNAYPIAGTWQDHLNRGSLGGIDYGMAVGTALPAAGGGRVRNLPYNGPAGHTVTIHHDNGYRTRYMHLSQFLVADGAVVGTGAVVGRSGGAPGSGNSTGPHLHWHMTNPSGARINPLQYIGAGVLPKTTTQWDGVPGPTMWRRPRTGPGSARAAPAPSTASWARLLAGLRRLPRRRRLGHPAVGRARNHNPLRRRQVGGEQRATRSRASGYGRARAASLR